MNDPQFLDRFTNPDDRDTWLDFLKIKDPAKKIDRLYEIAGTYKVGSLIMLSAALRLVEVEKTLLAEVADLLPEGHAARSVLLGRVLTLGRFTENLKSFAEVIEERLIAGENEQIEKFDQRLVNMALRGEDR